MKKKMKKQIVALESALAVVRSQLRSRDIATPGLRRNPLHI